MNKEKIKVVVVGAYGRMGQEVVKAVLNDPQCLLVGAVDVKGTSMDVGNIVGIQVATGVTITDNLEQTLIENKPDAMVDFTNPQAVLRNAKIALKNKVRPVIGTTGLSDTEMSELEQIAEDNSLGLFVAPNFALGAVLMMRFSTEAAKYMPNVEIIELHHDQKLDAPSGTALRTAMLIDEVRQPLSQGQVNEYEKIEGVRGGDYNGFKIHSVRLPGLVAHQEVIFGGLGQTLTIRHDSFHRESFMPGVILAIHNVIKIQGLVCGLENLLD